MDPINAKLAAERMSDSQVMARLLAAFIAQYRPVDCVEKAYWFEADLARIVQEASIAATRPFAYEVNRYRELSRGPDLGGVLVTGPNWSHRTTRRPSGR
jgi:hypothetical protein